MKLPWLLSPLALGLGAIAQSFVSPPTNVEIVLSEKFPGAKISYKQVHNLCETTEGVKSFSGYVSLPKDFIPDATNWDEDTLGNFFFWYFEARDDPENAPTSIYLGGGPGYTSFDGSSVFPCFVNPDSNSTTLNKHSWNNHVNMLYIEQPLGTGFSYTKIENGTYDTVTGEFTPVVDEEALPELNITNIKATLQTAGIGETMNTTKTAARTLWRFAQVWFNEFPERATKNDELAIWAVSYGGLYAPVFSSYFIDQNKMIQKGDAPVANSTILNLVTVGLLNAMVDIRSMALGFPDFALNNTYDLPTYSEEVAEMVFGNITAPDVGCLALVDKCRAAVAKNDPESTGTNESVNEICLKAMQVCFGAVTIYDEVSPYHHFDITLNKYASHPTEYETALFNQPWVQQELGVPLNYTRGNNEVEAAFLGRTGDMVRYGLEYIEHLLENGVNIAMVNGDRDFRCNWFSGERASLNISFSEAKHFAAAGYQPIITDASHEGGFVREYGNLSFSRVFQAGHSVGGYQPETVSAIFERAMFRSDVATGKIELTKTPDYASKGNASVRDVKNKLPELIENICYVLSPGDTCTPEQVKALQEGTAETEDWVVVKPAGTKGERALEGDGDKNSSKGSNQEGSQTTSGGVRLTDSLTFASLLAVMMVIF
ncbi:hypothetical protein BHE90_002455 [Fusarium euwallaceae]|uniref:Uncharacterized protein n=1 Tax=Fusarium euwallaceae TaxID=1147111 RepID=A0A430M4S4_9HYPO|nr:hypothetical protein BHE90_002455 [Fusarium euwallaceae]